MALTTNERRDAIFKALCEEKEPISAKVFAVDYGVSRQVIVQDIAVLRAAGNEIISTNRGYYIINKNAYSKEFKVRHGEDQVADELNLIVDLGGAVKNVSISHRIYGRISANLSISSRQDVLDFVSKITDSSSMLLGNATSGYHYHLVEAPSEERLELIGKKLEEAGFLVPLLPWEQKQ